MTTSAKVQLICSLKRSAVLDAVCEHSPISPTGIGDRLKLTLPTVTGSSSWWGWSRRQVVAEIVKTTGAKEVHFAARKNLKSLMTYRVPGLLMGANYRPDEYSRKVTDEELIRKVISAAS